ncbi:MAG: DUF1343 domain-containing protein [Spirochaetales bacterium]|nr:DUF1343 domain-containing protein [Spirochaetales bacterium]
MLQALAAGLLVWFSTSCCSVNLLEIDPFLSDIVTRLELESRQEGRIRTYRLPDCCWPETPEAEGEQLLPVRSRQPLYTGLDILALEDFALLRHRSFALLTNATGRDRSLTSGLDLMLAAGVRPRLVLEPEHGLYGYLDAPGADGIRLDPRRGLRVLSLYSSRRVPDVSHLVDIDLLVVDIQNLPVRCYTYVSTLTYLLELAAAQNIEVLVLDRPNPYGFWHAQGSMVREDYRSFVAEAPVPFLYSMTPGEYSQFVADLLFPDLRISTIAVAGYRRQDLDAPLRASWINPSPNIPGLESALVYPGVVLYEGTNFSLGRGTTRPFIYSGAPWLNSALVAEQLRALQLPGVEITEVSFQPSASLYQGQICHGIQINPVSTRFDTLRTGYEYMRLVRRLHPDQFRFLMQSDGRPRIDVLWGGPGYREAIQADLSYEDFRATWSDQAAAFEELTAPYRLY